MQPNLPLAFRDASPRTNSTKFSHDPPRVTPRCKIPPSIVHNASGVDVLAHRTIATSNSEIRFFVNANAKFRPCEKIVRIHPCARVPDIHSALATKRAPVRASEVFASGSSGEFFFFLGALVISLERDFFHSASVGVASRARSGRGNKSERTFYFFPERGLEFIRI